MCSPVGKRYNLLGHLRVLFKFLSCLGLTGIAFNQSRQTFERPKNRRIAARCMYTFVKYVSGLLIFSMLLITFGFYLSTSPYDIGKSVEAQENTISKFSNYIHTTSACVYASHYLRTEGEQLALFNKALKIFKSLSSRTGPELFLGSDQLSVLAAKAIILAFIMKYMILFMTMMLFVMQLFLVDYTLFPILNASMVFSYIYVQVALLCFYEKMSEYLQKSGVSLTRPQDLARCLRAFMAISRRIHALNLGLNSFATSVFFCTYIGLFHDIEFVYLTLKTTFYHKYYTDNEKEWLYFPACLAYTLDMFIIGRLSDLLEGANDRFQTAIEELSSGTPALQRDVEVMLMRDNICGLGLRTLGQVKVNQQFSFDFTINIVLVYVITLLQFFAAEQIYTDKFQKLNVSVRFVVDL